MDQFIYPLEQLSFTEAQKASITKLSALLSEKAQQWGHPRMFWELDISCLDSINLNGLTELSQFREELAGLKSKLEREIESESLELSKVIIEKVSAGSGLNPQTVH